MVASEERIVYSKNECQAFSNGVPRWCNWNGYFPELQLPHSNGRAMGTIIAYIVGACLVTLVMMCLGELSVHEPHTSSFHNYATKYIHPSVGFVVA